jgi:hypothetical protein
MLVTGIQASGKSTIAHLLAGRLPKSVHVRGDLFRRMIINGRADMPPILPAKPSGSSAFGTSSPPRSATPTSRPGLPSSSRTSSSASTWPK